ncbi:MAG TPA: hypothetical protein DIS98_12135 [Colwellia sp.]|nr:hypothetical protein [Colwellia sp.]
MIHRTGKRLKYSVFWLEGKYFGSLQQPIINYLDCFFTHTLHQYYFTKAMFVLNGYSWNS